MGSGHQLRNIPSGGTTSETSKSIGTSNMKSDAGNSWVTVCKATDKTAKLKKKVNDNATRDKSATGYGNHKKSFVPSSLTEARGGRRPYGITTRRTEIPYSSKSGNPSTLSQGSNSVQTRDGIIKGNGQLPTTSSNINETNPWKRGNRNVWGVGSLICRENSDLHKPCGAFNDPAMDSIRNQINISDNVVHYDQAFPPIPKQSVGLESLKNLEVNMHITNLTSLDSSKLTERENLQKPSSFPKKVTQKFVPPAVITYAYVVSHESSVVRKISPDSTSRRAINSAKDIGGPCTEGKETLGSQSKGIFHKNYNEHNADSDGNLLHGMIDDIPLRLGKVSPSRLGNPEPTTANGLEEQGKKKKIRPVDLCRINIDISFMNNLSDEILSDYEILSDDEILSNDIPKIRINASVNSDNDSVSQGHNEVRFSHWPLELPMYIPDRNGKVRTSTNQPISSENDIKPDKFCSSKASDICFGFSESVLKYISDPAFQKGDSHILGNAENSNTQIGNHLDNICTSNYLVEECIPVGTSPENSEIDLVNSQVNKSPEILVTPVMKALFQNKQSTLLQVHKTAGTLGDLSIERKTELEIELSNDKDITVDLQKRISQLDQSTVASPSEEAVVASPSEEAVVASPSEEAVVASPSEEAVVASPSEEAVVASEEAVVASEEAVVASEEAVVASEEAVVASEEAVVASEEAVVASEEAVVASEEAVVASEEAVVASEEAVVASEEAVVASPVCPSVETAAVFMGSGDQKTVVLQGEYKTMLQTGNRMAPSQVRQVPLSPNSQASSISQICLATMVSQDGISKTEQEVTMSENNLLSKAMEELDSLLPSKKLLRASQTVGSIWTNKGSGMCVDWKASAEKSEIYEICQASAISQAGQTVEVSNGDLGGSVSKPPSQVADMSQMGRKYENEQMPCSGDMLLELSHLHGPNGSQISESDCLSQTTVLQIKKEDYRDVKSQDCAFSYPTNETACRTAWKSNLNVEAPYFYMDESKYATFPTTQVHNEIQVENIPDLCIHKWYDKITEILSKSQLSATAQTFQPQVMNIQPEIAGSSSMYFPTDNANEENYASEKNDAVYHSSPYYSPLFVPQGNTVGNAQPDDINQTPATPTTQVFTHYGATVGEEWPSQAGYWTWTPEEDRAQLNNVETVQNTTVDPNYINSTGVQHLWTEALPTSKVSMEPLSSNTTYGQQRTFSSHHPLPHVTNQPIPCNNVDNVYYPESDNNYRHSNLPMNYENSFKNTNCPEYCYTGHRRTSLEKATQTEVGLCG